MGDWIGAGQIILTLICGFFSLVLKGINAKIDKNEQTMVDMLKKIEEISYREDQALQKQICKINDEIDAREAVRREVDREQYKFIAATDKSVAMLEERSNAHFRTRRTGD